MSYPFQSFSIVEAILLALLGIIFYLAVQSGDLLVISLSVILITVLIAYNTLRRQRAHGF